MGKKRVAIVPGEQQCTQTTETEITEAVDSDDSKNLKNKKKIRTFKRTNFYVRASYNNTTITTTDEEGGVIAWSTAGLAGFKGPRKSTPYASSMVVSILLEKLDKVNLGSVHLYVSGIGSGRDAAVRALTSNKDLNIVSIKDITPLPHNGCKPKKMRRT